LFSFFSWFHFVLAGVLACGQRRIAIMDQGRVGIVFDDRRQRDEEGERMFELIDLID
jgi:hypothetical protein